MFRVSMLALGTLVVLSGTVSADPPRRSQPSRSGGPGFMQEAGVVRDPNVARALQDAFGLSGRSTPATAPVPAPERWRPSLGTPTRGRDHGVPRGDAVLPGTGGWSGMPLPPAPPPAHPDPWLPSPPPAPAPWDAIPSRPSLPPGIMEQPWNHREPGGLTRYTTAFTLEDAQRVMQDLVRGGHGGGPIIARTMTYGDATGQVQTKTLYDVYYRPAP